MARAYSNAKIIGFDYHKPSIERATKQAEKEDLRNVTFEVANSTGYQGDDYDLITFFDCFHDMGDPVGAAKHALETLELQNLDLIIMEGY